MADSIRIDTSDVQREVAFFNTVYPRVRKRIWVDIRKSTFKIMTDVKNQMPVDFGRARASWGIARPGELARSGSDFNPADAIWELEEDKLQTTQGTQVQYVEALNQGHSQQAPAGFIDTIVLREGILLADKLGADIEVEFRE